MLVLVLQNKGLGHFQYQNAHGKAHFAGGSKLDLTKSVPECFKFRQDL